MAVLANLARMQITSTGTGTLSLGDAVPGFITFEQAGVADGAVVSYAIAAGAVAEVGRGTYNASAKTLTRGMLASTTGSVINVGLPAEVFITALAQDFDDKLSRDGGTMTGSLKSTFNGTGQPGAYPVDIANNANQGASGSTWRDAALVNLDNFSPAIRFRDRTTGAASLLMGVDGNQLQFWSEDDAGTLVKRGYFNLTNGQFFQGTTRLAPVASPPLTGTPTAPTAAKGTNTPQIATMAAIIEALGDYTVTTDADSRYYRRSEPAQVVSDISGITSLGGFKNKIINPNGAVNQRRIFTWTTNVFGADRWKGHANGKEQVIEQKNVPAGTYILSWAGGGQGRINGGTLLASPIQVTLPGTANVSVVVPSGATAVQFEAGTVVTPLEQRPDDLEKLLCMMYWQKTFPQATTPSANQGFDGAIISCAVGVNIAGVWTYSVPMRAIATLTAYNPANDATPGWRNFANNATSSATIYSNTERGVNVIGSAASSNQFHGIHLIASAEVF